MKYRGRGENDQEINGPVRREKGGSDEGTKEEKEDKWGICKPEKKTG